MKDWFFSRLETLAANDPKLEWHSCELLGDTSSVSAIYLNGFVLPSVWYGIFFTKLSVGWSMMISWRSRCGRSSDSVSGVYQTRAYDNKYEVIENMISKESVVVERHAMFELLFVTTKDMRDSRDWHIVLRLEITFRVIAVFIQNISCQNPFCPECTISSETYSSKTAIRPKRVEPKKKSCIKSLSRPFFTPN